MVDFQRQILYFGKKKFQQENNFSDRLKLKGGGLHSATILRMIYTHAQNNHFAE